ncbi:MAG: SusC/RagA family TonB-linked outer membrane protein [Balneolaceae bacterium]|nr:SusC/RagA family TonB-linked outer membrane protein [Balneolaceae bacterium]
MKMKQKNMDEQLIANKKGDGMRIEIRRILLNAQAIGSLAILIGIIPAMSNVLLAQSSEENRSSTVHSMTFSQLQEKFYKTEILEEISLNIQDLTLQEALREIARETGLRLSYRGDIVADKKISLQEESVTVSEALKIVLDGTGLDYKFSEDGYLLIADAEEILDEVMLQETVRGTVVDTQTGEALPGVNVVVEGTTIGTATNIDGEFELDVSNLDEVLVFSYIGYDTQVVGINGRTEFEVFLNMDIISSDEIMVVGYGSVNRSDLTGSIVRVNNRDFENHSSTGLQEILSGTVAGVFSNQGTTAAGGGSLEIRGTTSLKASNSPLIVVDGVIYNGSLNDINPSDIESIDVLKDASAAAVYGSRSASGVIIVSTKSGETGAPIINFTTRTGIVGLTNQDMRPLDPDEYIQARIDNQRQTYLNQPEHYFTNPNNLPSGVSLDEWMNYDSTPSNDPIDMWLNRLTLSGTEKANYIAGNTVDWLDLVRQNGIRQDYDVSVSGGTENLRYYWSGGYTRNQGYIIGDEFKTIRSRLNIDTDISDFLKIKVNTQFADRDQGFESASLNGAITGSPYGQIYSDSGEMNWYTHEDIVSTNPLIYHTYRDRVNRTQSLFANISAEIALPFDIHYSISYVNRFSSNRNYLFDPLETPRGGQNSGYGSRSNTSVYEWQVDNLIKWYNSFSDIHEFDFTFLLNFEKYQDWQESLINTQFAPTDALSFHSMGAGSNPQMSSNDEYSTGNALMGRLNYSLMNRYIFTFSLRRDGYSAFGEENPFAIFPSTAFAWRISEEGFFNINWIDNLKIRSSWGINGNRDIGRYEALARLTTVNYIYGNSPATGVFSNTMANSSLKWERTEALNLGFDIGFFNDQLNATIDLYHMRTRDLLMDRTLPSIMGYSSVAANLGEIQNRGIEITLNAIALNIPGKFQWNSTFNLSLNRNEIISLFGDMIDIYDDSGNIIGQREVDDPDNNWFIGESIYRIWDFERLGVWQLDEEEEAAIYGRRPGDIKLRDVNNDGVLNPADDKVFQGYRTPRYRIGFRNDFSYSNFELSMFIRADLGFYRENSIDDESSWIDRRNIYYAPYWTPENPSNEYAMLNTEKDAPYGVWKNSSFLRLQDVSLSYTMPRELVSSIGMRNLRVFLNLRNYYTITNWDSWDPESGRTPMPKYATFGIDISL